MPPEELIANTGCTPETKSNISLLDDIAKRAVNVADSLYRLNNRLRVAVNSIVGCVPSDECKDTDQPDPSNHKERMHSILTLAENDIDSMNLELDRL